jgi:hypothetical protein
LGIDLQISTSRHQQTNGQAEIAIRTYKRTARKYSQLLKPEEWETNLGLLEFALNNSINASTGFTPYYLAYGFKPRSFPDEYDQLTSFNDKNTKTLLETIENSLAKAQDSIRRSQEQHCNQYNRHRIPAPKYKEGDLVMLSSEGIHWPSESTTPKAFKTRYLGPLRVSSSNHDMDNYTLDFPKNLHHGRFWPTFHVSHLKKFQNRETAFPTWRDEFERPAPVAQTASGCPLFAVDRILNHKKHGKNKFAFLIGFRGYPDSQNEFQVFDPKNPTDWADEWPLLQDYVTNHPNLSIPVLQLPCPTRAPPHPTSSRSSPVSPTTPHVSPLPLSHHGITSSSMFSTTGPLNTRRSTRNRPTFLLPP